MSVTLNNYGKMANMNTAEFYGKSTDEKPTEQNGGNIINGSIYVEIDTGRAYFYDAEMKMWTPVTPPSADGTYTKEQIDALLDKIIKVMTETEYNALSDAEKMNGTIYGTYTE